MMHYLPYMIVMAGVTYLIRMLPLAIFQKEIKNKFIRSFLYYVPYTVLTAMTLPAILSSTTSFISASAGLIVAIFLAYKEKGLLSVAMAAVACVFIVEQILTMI
ncbi:MAG: AzlD domain-containing protein [Erysipelotrichaceae bacterium]